MNSHSSSVTIQGQLLQAPRHICCFFDSRAQQYRTLIPYFAEGLANGEQVLTVMDGQQIPDHNRRLAMGGIPVKQALESRQLCSYATDETYLLGGRFEKGRMLRMLDETLKQVRASGFKRLRTCGDMSWVLRNMPGTGEAIEYESEVNRFLDHHDATFVCVYDANRISGSMMRDILNTHSLVLMNGAVYQNPYYLQPNEYTATLKARRAETLQMAGDI